MAIVGDNTQGTSSSPGNSDRAIVTRFTAGASGSNGTAHAYFDSSSGAANVKWLLYSNSAGAPGSLLFASAGAACPAGGGLVNFGSITGVTWTNGTDYFIGIVYEDYPPAVSMDGSLSGIDTEMANGTLSYATPPSTWPGTDITYDNIRVNAYADFTESGGGIVEPIPNGALRLTSFAPNTYRSIVEPIPSKTLVLTSFAPTVTVVIPPITKQIPSISLRLTSFAPAEYKNIVRQIPSSLLRLTGIAPATYQNVVKQIPSSILRLTGFSPNDYITSPGSILKQVPSANIVLTSFAPNATVNVPGVITKSVPSNTLQLVSFAPVKYRSTVKQIPSTTLNLVSFSPNDYIVIPGQVIKQIPPGVLQLTSYAPNIPSDVAETSRPQAGGKVRHRPQRLVIIGKKRYRVDSYDQVMKLLRDYLKEQEKILEEEQVKKVIKNKKKIKLLKSRIDKVETQLAKANTEWQKIQQENEDIILMMVA